MNFFDIWLKVKSPKECDEEHYRRDEMISRSNFQIISLFTKKMLEQKI